MTPKSDLTAILATLSAITAVTTACNRDAPPAPSASTNGATATSARASASARATPETLPRGAGLAPPYLAPSAVEIRFVIPDGPIPLVDAEGEREGRVSYFYEASQTLVSVEPFGKEACSTVLAMKPEPSFPVMEPRKIGERDALYTEGVSQGRTGEKASVGYTVCTEAGPVQIITMAMRRATLEPSDRERALAVARSLTIVPRNTKAPEGWVPIEPGKDVLYRASFPKTPDRGKDPLGVPYAGVKLGADAALHVMCQKHEGKARELGETWFGYRRGIVGTSTIASETQIIRGGDGEVGIEIDATRTEKPELRARFLILRRGATTCAFSSLAPPAAPRDADVRSFFDAAGVLP